MDGHFLWPEWGKRKLPSGLALLALRERCQVFKKIQGIFHEFFITVFDAHSIEPGDLNVCITVFSINVCSAIIYLLDREYLKSRH